MMYSFEKPTIVTDATEYTNCIGRNSSEEYGTRSWNMFDVFPEKIMGEVQDFNYVYYNPWDPQFVTYMTVDYDGADYEKEMKRLGAISTEEYLGYYSVTGEPEGYDLVAMDSDDYSGFCYAMIPEEGGSSITYVGIVFCNYFLDLDINEHMPAKYLLPGFDATSGNPYERKMMKILMYNPVYRPKIKQSFLISWHKIRKKQMKYAFYWICV